MNGMEEQGTTVSAPLIQLRGGALQFGNRVLWQGLDLDVHAGEFLAVLGPNGTGKTSLLKALLGLVPLSAGELTVAGRRGGKRGNNHVGYVPQQKGFPQGTPLRAKDLVSLGIDGNRWGIRWGKSALTKAEALLDKVGASSYANVPVGLLSGGEQQRLRVAQALSTSPEILLCDEPLLSLDMANQRAVSELIGNFAHQTRGAVVFVTHEINPVVDYVDKVLYLAGGKFTLGTPDEVMRTEVLSELYGTGVEVFRSHGRYVVVGLPDATTHAHHDAEEEEH